MTHLRLLAFMLIALFCGACGNHMTPTVVKAAIINKSQHNLDWVRMEWVGPNFSAGVLSKDIFSVDMDLRWPYVPDGTLTFVDATTRTRYRIPISFTSINEKIRSGAVRAVTIRILDYDKAEVEGDHDYPSGYPK